MWRLLSRTGALALLASVTLPMVSASAQASEQSKPAAQIFADGVAAMRQAKDFHVAGHVTQGKQVIALNLTMSPNGGGGSVGVLGATIQMVVTSKYVYMKADSKSWTALTHSASVAQLVANRWLKAPVTNSQFASFAQLSFSNKFLNQVASQGSPFSKLGLSSWDGRSAIVLKDAQGSNVYIAAYGAHYVLGVSGATSGAKGSLSFTDFGTAPMPAVPTTAITIPGL